MWKLSSIMVMIKLYLNYIILFQIWELITFFLMYLKILFLEISYITKKIYQYVFHSQI